MSGPVSSPASAAAIHPALSNRNHTLSVNPADLPLPLSPLDQRCFSDGVNKPSPAISDLPQTSNADVAKFGFTSLTPLPSLPDNNNILRNGAPNVDSSPAPPPLRSSPSVTTESNAHPTSGTPAAPARGHRKNALSIESVPRQTIMKALASVARNNKPQALSLSGMLSAHSALQGVEKDRPASSSSQQLCDALNGLAAQQNSRSANVNLTPTAAFPSLQSPCFYHNRFDDAVDFDKVLDEIQNDEYMSHSRLVQTATGVRNIAKQLQRRPIKRAVKNIMIVTKARDNTLVLLTRELAQWLLRTPRYGSDVGVNVYVDAKLRHSKRFNAPSIIEDDPRFEDMLKYWTPDLCWSQPEKFDLVLTLGGDGTVLFTSWLFQRIVPPILSFSLGSLGFLTTFEFEKYKSHLNRIMGDEGMRVNLRMRFTCTVYRDTPNGHEMEEGEQFEVLNELVIDRGPSPYVSNLELYGDNELLTVVQADGCIFSTPTGKFPTFDYMIFSVQLLTCHRIHRLLIISRRFSCPPRYSRHSLDAHLPTYSVIPPHGAVGYHAPSRFCSTQQPRDRLLRIRRQGPCRAQARRSCHHHRIAVPIPYRRQDGH